MSKQYIFWCDSCQKKYFFDEIPEGISVANLQIVVPFIDPESQKKKQSVFIKRKPKHKCNVCGFFMKEISHANRNNSS